MKPKQMGVANSKNMTDIIFIILQNGGNPQGILSFFGNPK